MRIIEGSVQRIDFGEEGQDKGFYVLDIDCFYRSILLRPNVLICASLMWSFLLPLHLCAASYCAIMMLVPPAIIAANPGLNSCLPLSHSIRK